MMLSKNLKIVLSFFLLVSVVAIHFGLRISQLSHSQLAIGHYFWTASINLGAGKGFTDDPGYLQSPELVDFEKHIDFHMDKNKKDNKLSIADTVHDFTDYDVTQHYVDFSDSLGYRYLVGLVWKTFGFNWYFVGLLNYVFSLMALLALMFCSYRTLGISYSFFIGFIYAVSIPETIFVVDFSRDGITLWFASYLICSLIFLFNKPITFKRVLIYSIINGFLIFCSFQGRSSSIFFFPITLFIYAILIFFSKIDLKDFSFFKKLNKNNMHKKISYLFIFSFYTILIFLFLQIIFEFFLLPILKDHSGWSMHVIFLGLGVWGQGIGHPSQVIYQDEVVKYQAAEYASRYFGWKDIVRYDRKYGTSLFYYYFEIIKFYPMFFLDFVFLKSISKTLFTLGEPMMEFRNLDVWREIHFINREIFSTSFLTSVLGALVLYFKLHQRLILTILLVFIFSNAGMSFLQYGARHALMGHPAYYFLTGVAFAYGVSLLNLDKLQKMKAFFYKHKKIIARYLLLFLMVYAGYKIYGKVSRVEENNIRQFISYINSLEKHPLKISLSDNMIMLPKNIGERTVGIFCYIGEETRIQEKITFSYTVFSSPLFIRDIVSVPGKEVFVFAPVFLIPDMEVQLEGHCKALYWSDLSSWKGALWEGSYDRKEIKK